MERLRLTKKEWGLKCFMGNFGAWKRKKKFLLDFSLSLFGSFRVIPYLSDSQDFINNRIIKIIIISDPPIWNPNS